MPFGKFRGTAIEDLPDDYFFWLASVDLHGLLREAVQRELAARERRGVTLRIGQADVSLFRELLDSGFRVAARKYHPDVGGNLEVMKRLNLLVEDVRQQLLCLQV